MVFQLLQSFDSAGVGHDIPMVFWMLENISPENSPATPKKMTPFSIRKIRSRGCPNHPKNSVFLGYMTCPNRVPQSRRFIILFLIHTQIIFLHYIPIKWLINGSSHLPTAPLLPLWARQSHALSPCDAGGSAAAWERQEGTWGGMGDGWGECEMRWWDSKKKLVLSHKAKKLIKQVIIRSTHAGY